MVLRSALEAIMAGLKKKSPRIKNPRALKMLSYNFYIAPRY
jgi:hypothetical protein